MIHNFRLISAHVQKFRGTDTRVSVGVDFAVVNKLNSDGHIQRVKLEEER